ncbi:MAG TPA: TetR/AcrR family transcriptional regulator [Acidimicrobiales bacterium]
MAETRRSRTSSLDMEAVLLEAAADLLETEGPDGLSVRRIAAAAGVAPMGVYNHFASKFGIVEALFVQGFERLGRAMVTLDEIEDPIEALREGGRRYRVLALAHPQMYQVMFLRAVPGFEPSDDALEVAALAFGGLVTVIERGMAAGSFIDASLTLTAQLVWSAIHGWVSLELAEMGFVEDHEAGFAQVCTTVLDGLVPR